MSLPYSEALERYLIRVGSGFTRKPRLEKLARVKHYYDDYDYDYDVYYDDS